MGGNEKNEIFRQMRREIPLKYLNVVKNEIIDLEEDDYRRQVLELLSDNNRLILAKSRQMMLSTLLCAHAIKRALFNKKHRVLVVTLNNAMNKHMMNMMNNMLSHSGLSSVTSKENLISLHAGGEIIFANIRSFSDFMHLSVDTIIIDEAAYSEKLELALSSFLSQLKPGLDSQVIISSTPKNNSYFNYLFLDANKNPESEYTVKKLVYSDNPYMTKEKVAALSRSNYKNEELLCIVTHKKFRVRTKLITFRLNKDLLHKIKEKIGSDENGVSITDYLRRLIEKDIG